MQFVKFSVSNFQALEKFFASFKIFQNSFFQNFGNGKLGIRSKAGIMSNFQFLVSNFQLSPCHTENVTFNTFQYHF